MQSPEGQEGQTGTHWVEAKVEDTQIVEGKAVATAVALILNKVEGHLHMVVGWVEQVALGVEVELADQVISRLALMVHLVQAEGLITINKVVLATSSSMEAGNSTVPSQWNHAAFLVGAGIVVF
jgi:hypothetical protein